MTFDSLTLSAATAAVAITAGVLFLLETMFRPPTPATRLWSVSFLATILAAYLNQVGALGLGGWIAGTIGNLSFAAAVGFLWLGCARFNNELTRARIWLFAGVLAAIAAVSLIAGPGAIENAWPLVAVGLAVLSALGALDSRRGVLGQQTSGVLVTIVFGSGALYLGLRIAALLFLGPAHPVVTVWFGEVAMNFLGIVFVLGMVVSLSVLRAIEPSLRGRGRAGALGLDAEGLFDPPSFELVLDRAVGRAAGGEASLAVVSMRMDELPRIATAFGLAEAAEMTRRWRAAVRDAVPLWSVVAEHGPSAVVMAFPAASVDDARQITSGVRDRVLDALAASGAPVVPELGVGIKLVDPGATAASLIAAADAAARDSGQTPGAEIRLAG